jgi:hypothetical protein
MLRTLVDDDANRRFHLSPIHYGIKRSRFSPLAYILRFGAVLESSQVAIHKDGVYVVCLRAGNSYRNSYHESVCLESELEC